jgi:hypothetical protein
MTNIKLSQLDSEDKLPIASTGVFASNSPRPNWAQLATFLECTECWIDLDDDEQPSLTNLKTDSQVYNLSIIFPNNYKPDLGTYAWDENKPHELAQSGFVSVKVIKVGEVFNEQPSFTQKVVTVTINEVIPFSLVSDRFSPDCSEYAYPYLQQVMSSYVKEYSHIQTSPQPGYQYAPNFNIKNGYTRIAHGDLIAISFTFLPSDFGGWIICQKSDEWEYPVMVAYHESMISQEFTFVGHRPLTEQEWDFFSFWED